MTKSIWGHRLFKSRICKIQVPRFEWNSSVSWRDNFHWKHEIRLLKSWVQSLNSSLQQMRFKNSSFPEQLLNMLFCQILVLKKELLGHLFVIVPRISTCFSFSLGLCFKLRYSMQCILIAWRVMLWWTFGFVFLYKL